VTQDEPNGPAAAGVDGPRRLEGRRAVVTGGAGGIGLATARRFAAEGARVLLWDVDPEAAERALAEAPEVEGAILADVGDAAEVARGFGEVDARLGGIDVLVANAGISRRAPVLEISPRDWELVLQTNLGGAFFPSQQAARRMMASPGGGTIAMTASTNGITGHPLYAGYNASKAGVIMLARTMALELAPKVRVNAVCPGYVLTPMQRAEYTPEMLREVDRSIPLGRHATPEEVAGLFAYLCSDEAAYVTGQAVVIDGGELA
jgi:meso-butanediol dehydrogenase / (S,S)-butanediol dehydrogenase / diacetyl reductase